MTSTKPELPVIAFKTPKAWATWLKANHAKSAGVWLKLAKKDSGIASVNYAEAVEVALCYGWIDGQKNPFDATAWLQKFTPRGPKSIWSKINRAKAEALMRNGHMQPAGLKAIEAAKQDGRWDSAYDSPKTATMPSDLAAALEANARAKAFFATLNSTNRYAILFRLQTAKKAETRAKRLQQFVTMLEKHEKLYP